jgi:arsenical pump membrane protein
VPAGKLRALGLPRMVLLAGAVASIVAAASAPRSASTAASQVWPAFVLVIGLLLVGFAAAQDGAFTGMAAALDRLPGRPWLRYASSMALVAATSVLLNLDTAVLFLTPVLVLLARRQEAGEQAFLYGCVFVANSASLLLPGSNLTTLIVLQRDHLAGTQFAARLWPAWLVAVVVTAAVTAVLLRGHRGARAETHRPPPHRPYLSSVAIAAVTVALLASPDPALPVLAIGAGTTVALFAANRDARRRLTGAIDVTTVAGLFGLAVAAGTLGRTWLGPAHALADAGRWGTAYTGAAAAVLLNNLPAAALLSAHPTAHPRALLLGLDIGPNIAVTGSLSAVLWWQAARLVNSPTSARRYSQIGVVVAMAAIPLAVLALP